MALSDHRQNGRGPVVHGIVSRAGLVLAAVCLVVAAGPARAGTDDEMQIVEVGLTERVVIDRLSGVAIGGFDPVAYFVTGEAVPGKADFEVIWHGAAWRFANEGNMAAFAADPGVYAPCFGGYDASAIERGVAAAGNPRIFAIEGDRLYLFRDAAARAEFVGSPTKALAAEAAWPTVESRLIR